MQHQRKYLSRAWHDLRAQAGWIKPVLILGLVNCIPVLGQIFVTGYLLDWAREAAWGMTRSLPNSVGDLGKRGKWGIFAIVVAILWGVLPWAAGKLFGLIPVLGWPLALLCSLVGVAAGVLADAASVRMVIYDRIAPGLQFGRTFKMAGHDLGGLARCFCISLLKVPVVVVAVIVMVVAVLVIAFVAFLAGVASSSAFVVTMLFASPLLLAIYICAAIALTFVDALVYRAYGYWMRDFEPEKWGSVDEPMPFERVVSAEPQAAQAAAPVAEPQPQPQAQPAQEPTSQREPRVYDVVAEPVEPAAEPEAAEPVADEPPAAEEE